MGSKSDYLEAAVLNGIYGGPAFVPPATIYIALFTTGVLTDASTGSTPLAVEVTGGGYQLLAVTNNSTNFPAATGTSPTKKTNGTQLTFPTATADWGTITQWAMCDAATGGNILHYGTFALGRDVAVNDTATIAAGAVSITED